jgi:acetyltransferase-like isoleucine patch superfamily enzyme
LAVGKILGAIGRAFYRSKGVELAPGPIFNGWPIITMAQGSSISIGARFVATSMSRFTALGVSHPVVIRTLAPGAKITIGSDVGLSGTTICAVESVSIGNDCLFGADVTIVDTDFHPIAPAGRRHAPIGEAASRPCVIEDNVFIGGGAYILKGSHIGANSVIGSCSVVTGVIPPNCIAAGNPAKVIRRIDTNDQANRRDT